MLAHWVRMKVHSASAAVTARLPVAVAAQGTRPEQIEGEDEEEDREQVGRVLRPLLAPDVGDGDVVADEEDQHLQQILAGAPCGTG